MNIGEPPSKSEYIKLSNSEQVLRRKGEIETINGVKRLYNTKFREQVNTFIDCLPFV